jgi:hypothetical protein
MTAQQIRFIRRVTPLVFLIVSSAVQATDIVCASTADDVFQAMALYSDSGAQHASGLDLRLKSNKNYKVGSQTGNAPFTYFNSGPGVVLEITGNWNSDCSVQSTGFPTSILDGNNINAVVHVDNDLGGIYINRIIVQGGNTTQAGAGLVINASDAFGSIVSVTNSVIRNNTTTGIAGGVLAYSTNHSGSGTYESFYGNLITGNHADLDFGAGRINADGLSNGGNPSFISNVIYGNTSSSDGGLSIAGTGSSNLNPFVTCNVFRGNSNAGLNFGGNGAYLEFNAYGTRSGVAPVTEIGTVTAAPMFVDADNGDFHLAQGSPLIGAVARPGGGFCISSADFDGHTRTYTSISDIGVYVETIFGHGFDD